MIRPRLVLFALLCSVSAFANDYEALLSALKKAWPSVGTIAVVCDSTSSKAALGSLTAAAGGMKLMVVDVKGPQDMGKAVGALTGRRARALSWRLMACSRQTGTMAAITATLIPTPGKTSVTS